jgi:hypothetical protein
MDTQPTLSCQDLVAYIASETAQAVSERSGESRQHHDDRAHAATQAVLAFEPGDAIEAMIASHCVMLHELIVADVHHALCVEEPATRSRIVAMDRAFGSNLARLRLHRTATQTEPQLAESDRAETDIADRIRRHLAQIEPESQDTGANASQPASDTDAISGALSAMAQMTGLNRKARRALDRQSRKRAVGIPGPGVTPDRNAPATTTSATTAG